MIQDAFLRDIIEHRDDDAPRLIYADWLDDHGERDRAEFIRAQCELARIEEEGDPDRAEELRGRAFALERGGRKGWTGRWLRRALPRSCGTSAWEFRRGFVECVTAEARVFVAHAADLFRLGPVAVVGQAGPVYAYFYQPAPHGLPTYEAERWDNRRPGPSP